jgi:hypothetical protein
MHGLFYFYFCINSHFDISYKIKLQFSEMKTVMFQLFFFLYNMINSKKFLCI